ncbi:unnamed protein product [Nippostrongylus brasiliensis]|uniref:Mitochondrial inner membrane protein OXA1L (inferred by orthology to a human protein) n=1 Tax=Nippostrongylus brasiliensis TaxID=27835 RepID=A0A0N4YG53_NIPBR|nr:unnamed protein product [Nippostrongylus brasiliensis]
MLMYRCLDFFFPFQAGESVLGELGLLSWWKPSSYFRVALEGIHMHADIPWWATIVCATVTLRLALIIVPIMSQRLVAKQSQYKKELDDFRQRIESARLEGNNLLQQQIFLEQRDFLKSKDIRLGRQFLILIANGGVFATQFFAIKKMVEVNYPGLATGGTAWFTDLTATDPYLALPFMSAVTMALVTRVGIEMGTSADQMTPTMRIGMQYVLPVVIFGISSQFATGVCVYWCASNMVSLIYAGAFRTPAIRNEQSYSTESSPAEGAGCPAIQESWPRKAHSEKLEEDKKLDIEQRSERETRSICLKRGDSSQSLS